MIVIGAIVTVAAIDRVAVNAPHSLLGALAVVAVVVTGMVTVETPPPIM